MKNEPSPPAEDRIHALLAVHHVEAASLTFNRTIGEGAFAKVDLVSIGQNSAPAPGAVATSVMRQQQAQQIETDKTLVAVKRFKPSVMSDPTLQRLVLNEAELLHQLKHPFIVRALGVGCTDMSSPQAMLQTFFLLQEYVPGHNLRKLVTRSMIRPGGCYKRRDAIRWARQLASALSYLHSRTPRVMHRDVKLDNVLLTSTDPAIADVRLVDFGLGVQLPGYAIQEANTGHGITAQRSTQEPVWNRSMGRSNQPRGLVDVLVGSVRRGGAADSRHGKDKSHNQTSRSWAGSFRPFRRSEPQPPSPQPANFQQVSSEPVEPAHNLLLNSEDSSQHTAAAAITEGGSRHRGGNQTAAAVAAAKASVATSPSTATVAAAKVSMAATPGAATVAAVKGSVATEPNAGTPPDDMSLRSLPNLFHTVGAPMSSVSFRELLAEQLSSCGMTAPGLSLTLPNPDNPDQSLEFSLPLPPIIPDTPKLFSATSAPAGFDVSFLHNSHPPSSSDGAPDLTPEQQELHGLISPAKSAFRRSPFQLINLGGHDQHGSATPSMGALSTRGASNMRALPTLPTVSEAVGPGGSSPPALSTRSSSDESARSTPRITCTFEDPVLEQAFTSTHEDSHHQDTGPLVTGSHGEGDGQQGMGMTFTGFHTEQQGADQDVTVFQRGYDGSGQGIGTVALLHPLEQAAQQQQGQPTFQDQQAQQIVQVSQPQQSSHMQAGLQDPLLGFPAPLLVPPMNDMLQEHQVQRNQHSMQPAVETTDQLLGTNAATSVTASCEQLPALKPLALRRAANSELAPLGVGTSLAALHAGSYISSAGSTAGSTVGVASAGTRAGSVTSGPSATLIHDSDVGPAGQDLGMTAAGDAPVPVGSGKKKKRQKHSDQVPAEALNHTPAGSAVPAPSTSLQRTGSGRLLQRVLAKTIRRTQSHNVAGSAAHVAASQAIPQPGLESYADYVLHARTTEAEAAEKPPALDINALAQRVLFTTLDDEPDPLFDSQAALDSSAHDASPSALQNGSWQGLYTDMVPAAAGLESAKEPPHSTMAMHHTVHGADGHGVASSAAGSTPESRSVSPFYAAAQAVEGKADTGSNRDTGAAAAGKTTPAAAEKAVPAAVGKAAPAAVDHTTPAAADKTTAGAQQGHCIAAQQGSDAVLEQGNGTADDVSDIMGGPTAPTDTGTGTAGKEAQGRQWASANGIAKHNNTKSPLRPWASVAGSQPTSQPGNSGFSSSLLQHPQHDKTVAYQRGDNSSHHWSRRSKSTVGSPTKQAALEHSGRFASFRATFLPPRQVVDKNQTFDMTRGTGSLMYMAPEVFKGLPYNQKADVFSFGMCLYELLHFQLQLVVLLETSPGKEPQAAIHEYAAAVAAGYRPPLSNSLPEPLTDLLQRCWATNPLERPNMETVVAMLAAITADQLDQLDAMDRAAAGLCSCCTIC